jgi:hypothetical protein
MLAAGGCGVVSVQHRLFLHANPKLKNALGETALSIAEDAAGKSESGSSCNQVVAILRNPEQFAIDPLSNSDVISADMPTKPSERTPAADSIVGTYGGAYNGDDDGVFQADINQDGSATFKGHSNKNGVTFTHEGKINSDGSISFSSGGSKAVVFNGTVNRKGMLIGKWLNNSTNEAGSFQGNKGVQVAIPSTEILKSIGSLFGGSNNKRTQ